MGLALVLGVLGLFLEFRLAFWVTVGIPTAFLGSLLFLPVMGVSINMISMFAFIVALGLAALVMVASYALSGRIGMILMPRVESDEAVVTAVLPVGSPLVKVKAFQDRLAGAMAAVADENGGDQLLEGIFSKIDENQVEVRAYLTDPEVRPLSTGEVNRLWREKLGPVAGLESLRFQSDRGGPGSGAALTVELSHADIHVLDQAGAALAKRLAEFPSVKDIDDGYAPGKQQLNFSIKPAGQSLGLTSAEVARQVRNAFSGAEALKQQRGHNEVTVRVGPVEAIRVAGLRRFRPIVLTTLTTFGGLAPMIFETSRQARFMIPMALSLGFGILFATVITLILVPCLYLFIEDIHQWINRRCESFIELAGDLVISPDYRSHRFRKSSSPWLGR